MVSGDLGVDETDCVVDLGVSDCTDRGEEDTEPFFICWASLLAISYCFSVV